MQFHQIVLFTLFTATGTLGAAVSAAAPETPAPEIKAPGVKAPEVNAPATTAPEIKAPTTSDVPRPTCNGKPEGNVLVAASRTHGPWNVLCERVYKCTAGKLESTTPFMEGSIWELPGMKEDTLAACTKIGCKCPPQ